MKLKGRFLLYLSIFFTFLIAIMLWSDLHLNLEENSDKKSLQPELTVKGISFEREICDKVWKVNSPSTSKKGQLISATDIDALVKGKNEQTNIKAQSGNYHLTEQIFNFAGVKLTSKQNNNNYDISANNLSFEAQKKKWNLNGAVSADSDKISIKTNSAILLENDNTCELPNGGKITWKEKK